MIAANDNEPIGKTCSRCKEFKPLDKFHRQPSGKLGRHSYCASCACERQKETRKRNYSPEQKRKWLLQTRYGVTPEWLDLTFKAQNCKCAMCGEEPLRQCVDHNHETGETRGILCHRCNIGLPYVEDVQFRTRALTYLANHRGLAA